MVKMWLFWRIFLTCHILHLVKTERLPPAKFLHEFAIEHNLIAVNILFPRSIHSHKLDWFKIVSSDKKELTPLAMMFQDFEHSPESGITFPNKNLVVYISDESDLKESVDNMVAMFSMRTRLNSEIWMLDISPWDSVKDVITVLDGLPLDSDDDFYLYSASKENSDLIDIWELYQLHHSIPKRSLAYGNWSVASGLRQTSIEKWVRRGDFEGAELRVLSMPEWPYIDMKEIPGTNGELFTMIGIFADFWAELQNNLNFTYKLRKSKDLNWGAQSADGSWNGMIKELLLEEQDMGVTSFSITKARGTAITFTTTLDQGFRTFFIKNPMGSYNYKAYIEPLHHLSWIMIGVFAIITPFFMYGIVYVIASMMVNGEEESVLKEFTLMKCAILTMSSLTLRGWDVTPSRLSSRAAFFIIMLAAFILYLQWEAMLITYLSTRVIVMPFLSVQELLDATDYQIVIGPGTSYEDAFRYSSDPMMKRAYDENIAPEIEMMKGSGDWLAHNMKLLMEMSNAATFASFVLYEKTPQYEKCEILAIPGKFGMEFTGWAFQKNSPLLPIFNYYLKAMDEQGITSRIFAEYGSTSQECPNYNGLPLGFDSCIAAFVVFGVGISIAAIGFIVEILIPRSVVDLMPKIGGLKSLNEEGEPNGLSFENEKSWATKFSQK